MEERRVAIYARLFLLFLSVKLGIFMALVGTKKGGDQRQNRWEQMLLFLFIIDNDHKILGDGGDGITDAAPVF